MDLLVDKVYVVVIFVIFLRSLNVDIVEGYCMFYGVFNDCIGFLMMEELVFVGFFC